MGSDSNILFDESYGYLPKKLINLATGSSLPLCLFVPFSREIFSTYIGKKEYTKQEYYT